MTIESPKPPRPVQQPRVVDVSRPGGAGLTVEIDASEAAELLLSIATLLVDDEHDTYELGAARIEELRAAAPPELLRDADRLLPFKSAGQLLGLVYTTPKPRTAAAFVDHFAATDAVEIRLHLLGYYTRGHRMTEPETLRRAAEGDGAAIGELLDSYAEYLDAEKCSDAEQVLRTDAGEAKQALLELLSAWTEQVLPKIEPADYPSLLERDADAKRELVRSVPPEQVVERLAQGIQWVPGPDIDRVVLFPAYSPRPWVYMSEYKRVKIFCPPITVDREPDPGRSGRARPDLQGARRREPTEAAEAPTGRADLAHGRCPGDRPCEVDHASSPGDPAPGRLRADSGGRRHLQAAPRHAAGAGRVAPAVPRHLSTKTQARSRQCASPSVSSPACGNAPAARVSSSTTSRVSRTSGRSSGSATSRPASSTP